MRRSPGQSRIGVPEDNSKQPGINENKKPSAGLVPLAVPRFDRNPLIGRAGDAAFLSYAPKDVVGIGIPSSIPSSRDDTRHEDPRTGGEVLAARAIGRGFAARPQVSC